MADQTIYLVRHGETEWNRQGRVQGHLDSPLTPLAKRRRAGPAPRLPRCSTGAVPSVALEPARPRLIVVGHSAWGRALRGVCQGLRPEQTEALDEPQDALFRLTAGTVARIATICAAGGFSAPGARALRSRR